MLIALPYPFFYTFNKQTMSKSKLILIIVICISIFAGNNATAQLSSVQVDSIVQKGMEQFNAVGVAVAIVKDGKVLHEKGFGVQSTDTKLPVDEHTIFKIGSCTKAFTCAALSILVDEGKISWKDEVKKYLPEFKMYNDYVTENFLVEDLLCHRSGLASGAGDLMIFPEVSDFTIRDMLTNFQYFKPVSAFRTQFDYNNLLYNVAGELIARVSGMSWQKFVQTKILEPLKMNRSYSSQQQIKDISNVAAPHITLAGKPTPKTMLEEPINGAPGGILSNVDDMSKWMMLLLNKGKYGSNLEKQLFSEARLEDMWRIHTVVDGNQLPPIYNSHFFGYGLGWGVGDVNGKLSVDHAGGSPGMHSVVTMIPDINLGIVILINSDNGGDAAARAIVQTILDSYLGLAKMDYIGQFSKMIQFQQNEEDAATKKVWEAVALPKSTALMNEKLIGMYEDKWFGKAEVFLKGDQLWFRSYRSPKLNGPLKFYKANTFAIKWEYQDMNLDAFAMFNLDEEGIAQDITLKNISPNAGNDFQNIDFRRVTN
jgi:CubicO group peptidase (beta-lactamase class C family)